MLKFGEKLMYKFIEKVKIAAFPYMIVELQERLMKGNI